MSTNVQDSAQMVSPLDIVITGTGRSGTTFLTHVFYIAGAGTGELFPDRIGAPGQPIGGGMEHGPLVRLNNTFMGALRQDSAEELARRYADELKGPWPKVVKDPRFPLTWPVWNAAEIHPRHVFLCMRDPGSTWNSITRTTDWNMLNPNLLFRQLYGYMVYLQDRDIPYTPVLYPRIGTDRAYAERILGSFIDNPWLAVSQVWNKSLLHFQSSDSPACRLTLS